MLIRKLAPIRDPAYLKWIREEGRCVLTGRPNPDPAHIRLGWHATGMKPGDDLVIPLAHDLHVDQHNRGEVVFWLDAFARYPLGEVCLGDALRAWARQLHKEYSDG